MNNLKTIQFTFFDIINRFMLQKNIFPIQIFIILEKISLNFWTNFLCQNNLFFLYIKKNWILLFNLVLKNELFLNNNSLIESSYIDFNFFFLKNINLLKYKGLLFFNIYIYTLKIKFIVFTLHNSIKKTFFSLDKIFLNSNWLEREISEMYNIFFLYKNDTRNLLLEYSKKEAVMLKDYKLEGFCDIYYSFFENQVILKKNFLVEL